MKEDGMSEPFEHLTAYAAAGKLQTDLMAQIQALTAERDSLAAQVAALDDYLDHLEDCKAWGRDVDGKRWLLQSGKCSCGLDQLTANIPAAAAVYLAAQRVVEALNRDMQSEEWQIVSSGHQSAAVDDAMDAWRKSAGR
jgi:hypothetical protein